MHLWEVFTMSVDTFTLFMYSRVLVMQDTGDLRVLL